MKNQTLKLYYLAVTLLITFLPATTLADLSANAKIDALVSLAKEGDTNQFIDKVNSDKLLTKQDSDGHGPIFAAMFGKPELTNKLVGLGAPLEQKDNLGFTPLISAALLGYPEAVETLVKHGANVEAKNSDGQTALLMAVLSMSANKASNNAEDNIKWHNKWDKVIEILIKNGANVNATDNKGASPLFVAIFSNNIELCRYLIGVGANPNHKLNNGVSMINFAKLGASKDIVKLLVEHDAK